MHFKTFLIIALCVAYTIAQDPGEIDADAKVSDVVASDEAGSSEAAADSAEPEVEQLPENADANSDDTSKNTQANDAEPENEEPSENEATNDDAANDETVANESTENADESSDNDASESVEPEANESSENTEAASQEAASQEAASSEAASQEVASQEAASQEAASQEDANQEASENSNETAENGSAEGSDSDSNESDSGSTEAPEFSCQSVGRFQNPNSCEKYYFCWDTEHSYAVFSCPRRQAFDPLLQLCVFDFSVCPSAPTCEKNWQIIADPNDKSMFYECKLNGGGPLAHFEVQKQECDLGLEYDEEVGYCKNPNGESGIGASGKFECTEVGIFIDFEDETRFYECILKHIAKGSFKAVRHKCPKYHVFSNVVKKCISLWA